jgi:hypothetical protein
MPQKILGLVQYTFNFKEYYVLLDGVKQKNFFAITTVLVHINS